MNASFLTLTAALGFLICGLSSRGLAQDNVTIPKSRLEELERKEKELQGLKGQPAAKAPEAAPAKTDSPKPAAPVVYAPPPEPAVTYSSPGLDSLPAFHPFDTVESMDLANYYHADRNAADRRFLKQNMTVRGEIVGFEKPLWKRNYRILLKTPVREMRVLCDLLPPPNSNAVFTSDHGNELVALFNETRVPIARVGEKVQIKGECKGLKESVVMILGTEVTRSP